MLTLNKKNRSTLQRRSLRLFSGRLLPMLSVDSWSNA